MPKKSKIWIFSLTISLGILVGFYFVEVKATDCHTKPLWDWQYCTSDCQCNAGEGDCDGDFHCLSGYCALDVGAKYGKDRWLDVCEERMVVSPPEKISSLPSCQDSDGFSQDAQGVKKRLTSKGACQDGKGSHSDTCLDGNILTDYSCSLTRGENMTCLSTYYSCTYFGFLGCKEGRCFREGNLSLSLAEDNPSGQTILQESNEAIFLKAKFTASDDEDIKVNSLKVCSSDYQTKLGIKLGDEEESQVVLAESETIDDCAAFTALNWILLKGASKSLIVKADVKGEMAAPLTLFLRIEDKNVTASGLDSGIPLSVSGQATGNPMTITTQTFQDLCLDSDKGINEYTMGYTTKGGVTHYDTCFLGDNLKEWVCTAAGVETYKLIECEQGCVDGVCKKPDGNDDLTGVICLDSDSGQDYETPGEVKHGSGNLVDKDICQSEKTLKENYCQNGYFSQEIYDCPLGCRDGACLSESELKNIENNLASIAKIISQLMERIKILIGK